MYFRNLCSLPAFLTCVTFAAATCYYENGTLAANDFECGYGSNYCCPFGNTCLDSGLCQDKNNHDDGSLTYFPGKADPGPYNYTDLYRASSCQDPDWVNGCPAYCISGGVAGDAYLWACDDATTQLCCHDDGVALRQGDCCSKILFTFPSRPVALSLVAGMVTPSASSFATRTTNRISTRSSASRTTSTSGRFTYGFPFATQSTSRQRLFPTATDEVVPTDAADVESGSSLSVGAIIGTVVGTCFGAFLLTVLAVLVVTKRLRKNSASDAPITQQPGQPQGETSAFMESQRHEPVGVLSQDARVASAPPQMAERAKVSE